MHKRNGDVAQLARAFGSYPKGRGFDSLRRYQFEFSPCKTRALLYYKARLTLFLALF